MFDQIDSTIPPSLLGELQNMDKDLKDQQIESIARQIKYKLEELKEKPGLSVEAQRLKAVQVFDDLERSLHDPLAKKAVRAVAEKAGLHIRWNG